MSLGGHWRRRASSWNYGPEGIPCSGCAEHIPALVEVHTVNIPNLVLHLSPITCQQALLLVEPCQKPVASEVLTLQPPEQKRVVRVWSLDLKEERMGSGYQANRRSLHSKLVGTFLHIHLTRDFFASVLVSCASAHTLPETPLVCSSLSVSLCRWKSVSMKVLPRSPSPCQALS